MCAQQIKRTDLKKLKKDELIEKLIASEEEKSKLKKSQLRLEASIESTGIGIWEQDFANNKVFRSDNWFSMLGYRREDFEDDLAVWLNLIHQDDAAMVDEWRHKHEKGKSKVFKVEHRLKCKDGGWKWIINWGKIVERDKNGRALRAVGVHIDIDELKRAESEIHRLEIERSRILDSLDDLFVYYSKDLKIRMLNKAAEKYLGKTAETCIGKVCYEFWRENQGEFCDDCHVMRSLKDSKTRIKISKIEQKYYRFKAVPVKDLSGDLIGIAEFGQDITSMKEAELALRESETKYRKLTETALDIICIHDEDGKISYVNEAGIRLFGVSSKEIKGRHVEGFLSKENLAKANKRKKQRLGNDRSIFLYESEFIDKYGNTVPVEVSSSVIEKEGGGNDILIVARDITERKKVENKIKNTSRDLEKTVKKRTRELEKQKKEMERSQKALTYLLEDVNEAREEMEVVNKKLEDANKELEAFSYSVSHDLKAPLRALDGFSQILLEDYVDKLDESGKRYLKLIRENSQHMGLLIQDLLDFSRVGRYTIKIEEINMQLLVQEVVKDALDVFRDAKVEIDVRNLTNVYSDKTMLRQVWYNYISNAIKFSMNNKNAKVEIGCQNVKDNVKYYVKDNGVGFDMKYKHKLFSVFQRLHTTDEFEGTGVGLAIVKRIVKRLKGDVGADARVGKGAQFYFVLPVK